MPELSSKFTRDDVETLIEAMGDWEMLGNHEFNLMNMVLQAPMPPEDHEAFDTFQQIKNHFKVRQQEILDHRMDRQEKAIFLKAKLLMVRRELAVGEVFEMAAEEAVKSAKPVKAEKVEKVVEDKPVKSSPKAVLQKKLELAEFFIKDLGVWKHYQDFLAEQAKKPEE